MRNYILIAAAAITLVSCNNHEAELKKATEQRDSLMSIVVEKDNSINDFLDSYSEIERNLQSVSASQNKIRENVQGQTELKANVRDRINDEIASINQLMQKNRESIDVLNKKLKSSNSKNSKFEKMIGDLQAQLQVKEEELVNLNTQLGSLNAQVAELKVNLDTMTAINSSQSRTIADQTTAMHTAYYAIGKAKDLEEKKVINKEGGLLGIGKTAKLPADFDNTNFTQIDYTVTTVIPVNSEKAKLVTSHPSDSYSMEKENEKITNIRITNPDKFWSSSKYLVVVK